MRTELIQKALQKVGRKVGKNVGCRITTQHRVEQDGDCDFCTFDPACGDSLPCCSDGMVGNFVCCPGACDAPAELNISAEVDGGVFVNGIVMLYFYKARIHGSVEAPNSDIVIAERTRFDSEVFIHFYGTVIGCEIQEGVTVTSVQLWDPACLSITLQGFFLTNFQGFFVGPDVPTGPCAPFMFDSVTCNYFFGQDFDPLVNACPQALGCFA
jgi:hypothetical protein